MHRVEKQRSARIVGHVTKEEYDRFVALCDDMNVSLSTGLRILVVRFIEEQQRQKHVLSGESIDAFRQTLRKSVLNPTQPTVSTEGADA